MVPRRDGWHELGVAGGQDICRGADYAERRGECRKPGLVAPLRLLGGAVAQGDDIELTLEGIARGAAHTDIRGETTNEDCLDAPAAQQ
jgi:hypothetical protein